MKAWIFRQLCRFVVWQVQRVLYRAGWELTRKDAPSVGELTRRRDAVHAAETTLQVKLEDADKTIVRQTRQLIAQQHALRDAGGRRRA